MNKVEVLMSRIVVVFATVILLWIAASWIEVISHNNSINPTYSNYNAFTLIAENMKQ